MSNMNPSVVNRRPSNMTQAWLSHISRPKQGGGAEWEEPGGMPQSDEDAVGDGHPLCLRGNPAAGREIVSQYGGQSHHNLCRLTQAQPSGQHYKRDTLADVEQDGQHAQNGAAGAGKRWPLRDYDRRTGVYPVSETSAPAIRKRAATPGDRLREPARQKSKHLNSYRLVQAKKLYRTRRNKIFQSAAVVKTLRDGQRERTQSH